MMRHVLMAVLIAIGMAGAWGCTTKLVHIDSDPGLARVYVNGEYVGKTPLHHRFRDTWEPWPFEPDDNYTVVAKKDAGYLPSEKVFNETDAWLDLSYVPSEIIFELRRAPDEDDGK
ncbi:MAG: PEGA domain-containing protein [Thermodesulfobacteriota bacterium]